MKRSSKTHILIVDDNPVNLLTVEAILQPLDQCLVYANSGREALKRVLEYDFSVILMDAQMPGLDGFETVKLIRTRAKCRYTPIIFLSAAHQDEMDITQGYEIGAVDYLLKPINPKILYFKVQVFVELFTKSIHTQVLQNELKKRYRIEKKLKHLAERTQVILESAGEGIYGLNAQGMITFANTAAARILGRTIPELVGQSFQKILRSDEAKNPAELTNKLDPLISALKNGICHSDESNFQKKDGSIVPVEYTISPTQKLAGYRGAVVVFKDISRRKQAEQLLLQQQRQLELAHKARLSALEEMTSALAHELNQPLASIANYTRGCIRRLQEKSNMEEFLHPLEQTARLAERAGTIIHRIKNFVRRGELHCEPIEINQLILSIDNLINYEIKDSDITIQYNLSDIPLWVVGDKIQFEQTLLNLLRNGMEAMNQIDTHKPKQIIVQANLINDSHPRLIEVNILDTGPGFLPTIKDRLFDLYFTTKDHGMGIGLSICRTIIEAHGGNISAKENPAGGAWFQITLPAMAET